MHTPSLCKKCNLSKLPGPIAEQCSRIQQVRSGSKIPVNIQESPPPSSEAHPNKEKIMQKCQEAYMDEKGTPGQIQTQKKRTFQSVEVRTVILGLIERDCTSSQQ